MMWNGDRAALFLDERHIIARSRLDRNYVGEASRGPNMLLQQLLEDYHAEGIVIAATNVDEALDPAISSAVSTRCWRDRGPAGA